MSLVRNSPNYGYDKLCALRLSVFSRVDTLKNVPPTLFRVPIKKNASYERGTSVPLPPEMTLTRSKSF